MSRIQIINMLKEMVPTRLWPHIWWLIPVSAIVLLPSGSLFLASMTRLGLEEGPRLTQLLMLFAPLYGMIAGLLVLVLVDEAGLTTTLVNRYKWLARLAVVSPTLMLLILFLIFSRP